jgi:POT family proton-dependent oligopeptide transporter
MSTALSLVEPSAPEKPMTRPPPDAKLAFLIASVVVMIERFAFYLLFSLYTLYLTDEHHLSEQEATWNFGLFLAVMYFTPLFGGGIADRFGQWRTIILGAALLALGYLALALGLPVVPCVAVLATGVGLFKGNLTALVGSLFPPSDRDAAFSRFYWAVNLGALPSGVAGAWLHFHYGFRAAFLVCFVAMALVVPIGILTRSLFQQSHKHIPESIHSASERDRIATILGLLPVVMVFFCAFCQSGSSLTLFAKYNTRDTLLGIPILPPAYQSLQSALILGVTPVLDRIFRRWPCSTRNKLLIGMGLCSLSYFVMSDASFVASYCSSHGRVSPLWLISSYTLISIAELCVAPLGFSLVSKLSPPRFAGLLMGLWMAAIAIGNLGTGLLGVLWERWSHAAFFCLLTGLSALAIPLLWAQRHRLDRVLGGQP